MNDHAGWRSWEFGPCCLACGEMDSARSCLMYSMPKEGPFSFDWALRFLRMGRRVRRAGWNGKKMWIKLVDGRAIGGDEAAPNSAAWDRAEEIIQESTFPIGTTVPFSSVVVHTKARIDMRAADGSIVIGWLASQTDLLANDWELVP